MEAVNLEQPTLEEIRTATPAGNEVQFPAHLQDASEVVLGSERASTGSEDGAIIASETTKAAWTSESVTSIHHRIPSPHALGNQEIVSYDLDTREPLTWEPLAAGPPRNAVHPLWHFCNESQFSFRSDGSSMYSSDPGSVTSAVMDTSSSPVRLSWTSLNQRNGLDPMDHSRPPATHSTSAHSSVSSKPLGLRWNTAWAIEKMVGLVEVGVISAWLRKERRWTSGCGEPSWCRSSWNCMRCFKPLIYRRRTPTRLVSIRNCGVFHWRTVEIWSNLL